MMMDYSRSSVATLHDMAQIIFFGVLSSVGNVKTYFLKKKNQKKKKKLEQVDGAPSHITLPAPSHISLHIKIPNVFLQFSSIGLLPVPVTVSRF